MQTWHVDPRRKGLFEWARENGVGKRVRKRERESERERERERERDIRFEGCTFLDARQRTPKVSNAE